MLMEKQKYAVEDFVYNPKGKVVMVVSILKDNGKYLYECSDGGLYYGEDLEVSYE